MDEMPQMDDELNQDATDPLDSWLSMSRDAYVQSSDWFDASMRQTVEKALAHFGNRHAPGSKYHSDSYKFRAKGFRPKTRATIRRNEASAAIAFFSTQDMVEVTAENGSDKQQVLSASVLTELLNYRLDDSIPWFQTAIGSYQNALNMGVTVSHQYWEFEEQSKDYPVLDESGQPVYGEDGEPESQLVSKILKDKPRIDLVAIENFRLSPAADWTDPIGTSPYVIELIPMFIGDVRMRMDSGMWIDHEEEAVGQAAAEQYDSIRAARDGKRRQDGMDVTHATSDFDTVWVHRNIIRKDGEDYIYYTLGTTLMLSEPKRLVEEYRHLRPGERPYVMGTCIIEPHKIYPAGLNELTFSLQEEANEISNQRRDNVSLILNKRYFARRTANIDYKSLTRNVPGSITLVDDINSDIKWDSPGEVTGSSYQEQDRVSTDFDELAGAFSPGSVQSNRAMNETVGGMNLLSADSNLLTEYQLRVFSETWVEPVLKQLCRMEQCYETDEIVLAVCGDRAKVFQKFGIDKVTDAMLQGMVSVRVNVGFGATQPEKRIGKLTLGLQAIGQFMPTAIQQLDQKEVITEVFGALGFKGAERFFPQLGQGQDPMIAQLQQQVQQLQQMLQSKQMDNETKLKIADMASKTKLQAQDMADRHEFELEKMKLAMATIDKRLEKERNQIEVARLQNERAALMSQMHIKEREFADSQISRALDHQRADKDRQAKFSNPTGEMSQTLANDRYNMVPGAVG
jgi:hypothetical protein